MKCKTCGKDHDGTFGTGKYCSRSCANTRTHSKETKEKIGKSLIKKSTYVIKNCEQCGKPWKSLRRRNRRFCSPSCSTTWVNLNTNRSINAGRKSAEVQKETRRSKNEKLFAELCEKEFENVLTNEPMFNGWDADVILTEEKVAVLWNGPWHYKKITEAHSVKQVQNRDKIKIKEIKNSGFIPYTIKDMGKFNEPFVKKEFEKFKQYMRGGVIGNTLGS